ncbi:MAG: NAD(P)-binding protein [Devosiaceae bacterium]|nr:NAD(P)-binding protein [Devosiaceae bacterium]
MKISIIGAGISGLLSAFYLLRAGYEVEIFEKPQHSQIECYADEQEMFFRAG